MCILYVLVYAFIIPLTSDIITWNHKMKDLDPLCRFKQNSVAEARRCSGACGGG